MKLFSRKFKNDGYYHISIFIVLLGIAVNLFAKMPIVDASIRYAFASNLILVPSEILQARKLWTVLTYPFLEQKFIYVLFNSIFILWCGEMIEKTVGSKEFCLYYFLCVIFSALVMVALSLLPFGMFVYYFGSSIVSMAMLFIFSYYARNLQINLFFLIPLRAPLVILLCFIMDIAYIFIYGISAISNLICDIIGVLYATLYMIIRMKKDLKGLYKSILGL